tara:strand:- start:502 stop:675 length:174 start_codon:yes stop_codon:yes gene_type:complete
MHSQANATNLTTNYGTSKNTQNNKDFQKIYKGNHPNREQRLSIGTGVTEKKGDYTAI